MAQLDEGSVGIKVLAGLPDGNGLPPIASDLLDNPHPVYAIVELRPHKEEHRLDTDSHTVSLRITGVEPFDGEVADALRKQLQAQRERRTGVRSLPGIDDAPDAPPPATPEEGGWEDITPAETPSEAQAATSATDPAEKPAEIAAPPFAAPTPLAGKRRKG